MTKYYLAADLGASSGRLMLGHIDENEKMHLEEVHRFKNGAVMRGNSLCWEYDRLFSEILAGMSKCAASGKHIESIGIDTWGVDFVLLDDNGVPIGDYVAYRDSRTAGVDGEISKVISEGELYRRTGIQKQLFNTIYQLWTVKPALAKAKRFLMVPEYFSYLLSGAMINEYSNASTTGLLSTSTKSWDKELLEVLGYPQEIFKDTVPPGTVAGTLLPDIAKKVGFSCKVVLPATHDTASAVAAAPLTEAAIYISSGTWSLMGIESREPITSEAGKTANYTNEGGVCGTIRYLKNIMGLWMIQEVHRELGGKFSFAELADMAETECEFPSLVNVGSDRYLAPKSMSEEIRRECAETDQPIPDTTAKLAQCIFHSLAVEYASTAKELTSLTGREFSKICIVGGGCQNSYLNRLTARETGMTVSAGPVEATALGNIAVQMISDGLISDISEARRIIASSFEIKDVLR